MNENNQTVEKNGKSTRMSVNYSPKTIKNNNLKTNSLFHTVVIKQKDGDKVALTD